MSGTYASAHYSRVSKLPPITIRALRPPRYIFIHSMHYAHSFAVFC